MSRICRSTRLGRNFSNRAWVILRWPRYHQRLSSSACIASYSCGSKVCPFRREEGPVLPVFPVPLFLRSLLVRLRGRRDGDALLLRRGVLALLLAQEDEAHVPAADASHGAQDALGFEEL